MGPCVRKLLANRSLPDRFSRRAVDRQYQETVAARGVRIGRWPPIAPRLPLGSRCLPRAERDGGRYIETVTPQHGSARAGTWQRDLPVNVFRLAPFGGRVPGGRDAVGRGASPLWLEPFRITGGCGVRNENDREKKAGNGFRAHSEHPNTKRSICKYARCVTETGKSTECHSPLLCDVAIERANRIIPQDRSLDRRAPSDLRWMHAQRWRAQRESHRTFVIPILWS